MKPSDPGITPAQREAARVWMIRRDGGPLTASEEIGFRAWLLADPRHRQALAEVEALWAGLEKPARKLAARAQRPHSPWRWPARLGATMTAAALATIFWLAMPDAGRLVQDLGADAATGRGEQRAVTLPDGSRALLGPDTALRWTFSMDQRAVVLLRGEAFFAVQHGMAAFTVSSGQGTARVLGTRFDVERNENEATVTVEEGHVEVTGDAGGLPVVLGAGQRVELRDGRVGAATTAHLQAALAWREGLMVFSREPLLRVVARLERQAAGRILIIRPEVGKMRVSGAFPLADRDGALRALADTLNLRLIPVTPWITAIF